MPPLLKAFDLLKLLDEAGVEYVVIGGIAAILHGSNLVTTDLDVCSPMTPENVARIIHALRDVNMRQRMNPNRPPFPDWITKTPPRYIYAETTLGWIDFLGEVAGVGSYDEVKRQIIEVEVNGQFRKVLTIEALIAAKQAANRPKDKSAIPILEAIKRLQSGQDPLGP